MGRVRRSALPQGHREILANELWNEAGETRPRAQRRRRREKKSNLIRLTKAITQEISNTTESHILLDKLVYI